MEAANLIFGNAKSHRRLCCLEKCRLISHILVCVWLPESTLSTLKFILWGSQGARQKHRRTAAPLFSLWRRPCAGQILFDVKNKPRPSVQFISVHFVCSANAINAGQRQPNFVVSEVPILAISTFPGLVSHMRDVIKYNKTG